MKARPITAIAKMRTSENSVAKQLSTGFGPRAVGKKAPGNFFPGIQTDFNANETLIEGAGITNQSLDNSIKVTLPTEGNEGNEGEEQKSNLSNPTTAAGVRARAGQMKRNYMAQSRQYARENFEGKERREYMREQRKKARKKKHQYIGKELGTWDINE